MFNLNICVGLAVPKFPQILNFKSCRAHSRKLFPLISETCLIFLKRWNECHQTHFLPCYALRPWNSHVLSLLFAMLRPQHHSRCHPHHHLRHQLSLPPSPWLLTTIFFVFSHAPFYCSGSTASPPKAFRGWRTVFILASLQICTGHRGATAKSKVKLRPHLPGSRLGLGASSGWASSCPSGGRAPSPWIAPSAGRHNRDAA